MPGAVTKKVLKLVASSNLGGALAVAPRFEKNQPEGNSWFPNFSVLISNIQTETKNDVLKQGKRFKMSIYNFCPGVR